MSVLLAYGTALLIGSVHALEPDHVSAVTSFAARQPRLRQSLAFGLRWAVGHGAAVVLVGGGLILLQRELPASFTNGLERLVGLVLIALGAWTLRGSRLIHAHARVHANGVTHVHVHSHAAMATHEHTHEHRHGATMVGLLHGMAGSAPAVAIVPVAGLGSPIAAVGYLLVFALGTVAGMVLYALFAGFAVSRAAYASVRLARLIAAGAGCLTMGVGLIWLLR